MISERLNDLKKHVKRYAGCDVKFGDYDAGTSEYPLVVIQPDEGSIESQARILTDVTLGFSVSILAPFEMAHKAYTVLDKLMPEMGDYDKKRGSGMTDVISHVIEDDILRISFVYLMREQYQTQKGD